MKILGISASARKNGITSELVKYTLQATGENTEYISLAGKMINGCLGCTRCAEDNLCKVSDDWLEIGKKMRSAEAIIFGAPNYYGMINALGHACLERTFSFRHREEFNLAGKLGIIISVDGGEENSPVHGFIKRMMLSNKMVVVDTVYASGYSQCFTCGFGIDCAVGGVVSRHGFLKSIEPKHLPPRLSEQKKAQTSAYRAGKTLGSMLKARK